MGVPTSLPKLLRQFPWGFAGVVLGIGGMYIGLFYQRKPDLRVEILTNAAVVDVREDVSNLTIFYDSVDILRQHQSLRVVTTRFVNDGSADITGGMYDARDPVGVSFPGARIVQVPELLDASSEYLRDNVRVGLLDSSTFVFEPVILEAGESCVLKVLLLTADTASLSISPRGKVAGDRTIQLAESFGASADRRPVLERVFGGGLLIQLVRLVAYFVATALLVAAVAGAGAWSSSIPTKAKRRRLVRHIRVETSCRFRTG